MFIFWSIAVFIFGLIIGSFLNCLIWRMYKEETMGGRSYCPHCRQIITWYDNIPLLSFLLLRGRCRQCRIKISWQYPLVEFFTALLFLITFQTLKDNNQLFLVLGHDWFLIITLIIVFVYDLRWQLIPMNIIWVMSGVIFVFNLFLGVPWWLLLLFAAIGAVFFLVQYLLTKKKGIGEGDIWLGLFLGLAFPNASQLLLIMFLAYCVGAIVSLVLMSLKKKGLKSVIALGPFLALGAIITLIWGSSIINWYLGLF